MKSKIDREQLLKSWRRLFIGSERLQKEVEHISTWSISTLREHRKIKKLGYSVPSHKTFTREGVNA